MSDSTERVESILDLVDELNKRIAIITWLKKPAPVISPCGCMGPRGGEPRCPCGMAMVERVNGRYYEIIRRQTGCGIEISARAIS